jgi:hypothetical protein
MSVTPRPKHLASRVLGNAFDVAAEDLVPGASPTLQGPSRAIGSAMGCELLSISHTQFPGQFPPTGSFVRARVAVFLTVGIF